MNDNIAELDKVLVVEVDAVASLVIAATDQAAAVAASLNRAMADIAEASKVIRSLALQSKLLSLNAAIEAARAGEEGHGFGVVAYEVKALAVRSAGCADIIDDLVATVLHGLQRNNDVVHDLNVAVERGMAVVTTMTTVANIPSSFRFVTA